MDPLIEAAEAIRRVKAARNSFLISQVPIVELADLAKTEAARLDFPEARARRIADLIGRPDLSTETASNVVRMTEEIAAKRSKIRKTERKSAEIELSAEDARELETARTDEEALRGELDALLASLGFDFSRKMHLLMTVPKVGVEQRRGDLMLESLLITAVAQFETYVSRVISTSLRFDPAQLKRSGKDYKFEDVYKHKDLKAFVQSAADSFVDGMMRDGIDRWMSFLGSATKSDTAWMLDSLDEIIMRRNVHVHASGAASPEYIERLGKKAAAVKVGQFLPITHDYLADALDRLAVVVLVIGQSAIAAIRSMKPDVEMPSIYPDAGVVEASFDLLVAGRYGAVSPLHDRLGDFVSLTQTKEMLRANSLHAEKMRHGVESVRDRIKAWDVSAYSDDLKLVRHCLLDDIESAKLMYDEMEARGAIGETELAMWPILASLRIAKESDETSAESPGEATKN